MAIGENIRAGLLLADAVRNGAARAEQEVATAKLTMARAKGLEAEAALHRNQLDQAMAHQTRLAQAFLLHGQGPEPLPGDQPGAVPPGPQARLRQELSPDQGIPPAPTYERGQPGIAPTPGQTGTQIFQPPADEAAQRQAFAAKYGPSAVETPAQAFSRQYGPQPGATATPPPETPTEPSSIATVPTGTARLSPQPSSPPGQSTGLPGAPAGAPNVAQTFPIPQGQGQPARPLQMPAASVTATGPDDTQLLRNLSKSYFLANKPQEALAIYRYGEEQAQLRNLARVYRDVMADPGASEPQRRIALAGLGAAMVRAGKLDESVRLLVDQLPLSDRQVITQASVTTRDVLLEQYQSGQPLDVAAANKEADKRAIAKAEALREPPTQVVETDAGSYLVDKKTGVAKQITIAGTPGTGASPTPSGTPQPLPGKKMSIDRAKAYGFGSRALLSNEIIAGLEAQGIYDTGLSSYITERAGVLGAGVGALVLGILGRGIVGTGAGAAVGGGLGVMISKPLADYLRSDQDKLYSQAKLDFIASILRKESGAAISAGEVQNENLRYFPTPTDTPEVIAQKRQARLQVLAVLAQEAGRPLALPQAPPTPQTPAEVGIGQVGNETVRMPPQRQAPAARQVPQRQVPGQMSELLRLMSPETILGISDAAIEGVNSPSDVPGLSVPQQQALLMRLQRRSQQQPR